MNELEANLINIKAFVNELGTKYQTMASGSCQNTWTTDLQVASFRALLESTQDDASIIIPHCVVCNHSNGDIGIVHTVLLDDVFDFTFYIYFFIKDDALLVTHWSLESSYLLLRYYPAQLELSHAATFDFVLCKEDETQLECTGEEGQSNEGIKQKHLKMLQQLAKPTIPYRDLVRGNYQLGMIHQQSFRRALITCSDTTLLLPHTFYYRF
jgi:hypothetical protein